MMLMIIINQGFLENPAEQVRAQMDVGYSTIKKYMDQGIKIWYTHPRPNFGLFLIKVLRGALFIHTGNSQEILISSGVTAYS